MARKPDESERTCVVTRAAQPPEGLIRFVRGPDGAVVPDLREKLPGRGVWVSGRRDMVAEAVRRKLFARGFKADAVADPELPALVDRLLCDQALSALSMARKAGRVVTGFGKVTAAVSRGPVIAVIHAAEAAEDGRRKVGQAMRRRARSAADEAADDAADDEDAVDGALDALDDLDDDDDAPAPALEPVSDAALPRVLAGLFSVAELDLALGGSNVIHAALLAGGASTSFLKHAAALVRYRGGVPESDWIAGSGRSDDRPGTATR